MARDLARQRVKQAEYVNNGLGRFKDSPERLRAAADYLERHGSK